MDNIDAQERRLTGLIAAAPREVSKTKITKTTNPSWYQILKDLEQSDPQLATFRIMGTWKVCAGLSHAKEWARSAALTMTEFPDTVDEMNGTVSVGIAVNYSTVRLYGLTALWLFEHAAELYRRRSIRTPARP